MFALKFHNSGGSLYNKDPEFETMEELRAYLIKEVCPGVDPGDSIRIIDLDEQ